MFGVHWTQCSDLKFYDESLTVKASYLRKDGKGERNGDLEVHGKSKVKLLCCFAEN